MARKMDLQRGNFDFTRKWFRNRNLADFRDHVHPRWHGKQMTYLEIGCFEGMSMVWMLQHVLTHPRSRCVGIDPWLMTRKLGPAFMKDVHNRCIKNTSPWGDRRVLIQGCSDEVLPMMQSGYAGISKASVDVCMIDGNHYAHAVLQDARNVLPLMKPGGWMIFDDVRNDSSKANHVSQGIDMWEKLDSPEVDNVWEGKYATCYEVF